MKFRVWCTSWGETDKDGEDVVKCTFTEQLESLSKPWGVTNELTSPFIEDAEDAAQAYAEYVHDHRDGYECTWPLTFRVRAEDGTITDFEVDRDYEPTFSAAPIKEIKDGG